MAIEVKHRKVSTKSDGADDSLIRPSDWNDTHELTSASNVVLGRVSSGTGVVEELTGSQVRTIADVSQTGVVGVNTRTGSYTLVVTDRGKNIEVNVISPVTVTVPTNANVAFPIGTAVQITQAGAGPVTIAAASGVTINALVDGLTTTGPYSSITIYKRGTNEWTALAASGAGSGSSSSTLTLYDPVVKNGFHVVDPYGFASVSIVDTIELTDFNAQNASFNVLSADWQETPTGEYYWGVHDDYGHDYARIDGEGLHIRKVIEYTPDATPTWTYENHIILSMGQSLAIGLNATPILTSTQDYNSKMLSTGVRTYNDSPYTSATLTPLLEVSDAEGAESPMGGAAAFLNKLIAAENNIAYTQHSFSVLAAATGTGSTAISSHASGTTLYTRSVDVITKLHSLSNADNNSAACLGVFWIQGESDVATAQATYKTALQDMRTALTTSVQAVTGQTEPVKLFTYQTSSHLYYSQATPNSALAQLSAANDDANIYLATPIYHMDYSDGVHLTGTSSRHLGAYMALAYKRVIIDGLDWKPLQPKSSIRQGKTCVITFDVPIGPLVLDTETVSNPGNYGFALVDSAGSALTISSVSLIGPDRVKIVAAATIPSGAKVRYAWGNGSTANSGRLTGARGCLRDSAGDRWLSDFGKLHNWCVIFERTI